MASNNNADISSQTIATTYDQVLHIGDTGNLSGCGAGNEKYIVDGSGTASTLSIGTAKVGIGTASPNTLLHLFGNEPTLQLSDDSADGAGGIFNIDFCNQNTVQARIHSNLGNENLKFYTNADMSNAEMTIDSQYGGRVGIGTDTPIYSLEVSDPIGGAVVVARSDSSIGDGDSIGIFGFLMQDADGATDSDICAKIQAFAGETHDGASFGCDLAFYTANNSSTLTRKMTILDSGYVGIGIAAPTATLHVDQASSSGATTVLKLDQGDIDDTFIDFIGTSAADGSRSISSDTTTDSAKFGAIAIEINGVSKWIRIYDDHS